MNQWQKVDMFDGFQNRLARLRLRGTRTRGIEPGFCQFDRSQAPGTSEILRTNVINASKKQ